MNLPASQINEADREHAGGHTPGGGRAAAMKFTYPSGSRPLEGYTIKRGVGRGGFGEVYFATSDAGKEVALKLIRRNLEVELRGVTQCLNLKHPNLIDLFDIRSDGVDDQWVIMEYVCGESLEDVIDRHPNGMPIEQVLFWIRGMSAGVAYLHDHGIVHRDLKPGNIFLDESTVKIGDYGLAKFISCSRRSGQTESVGTVHYMAPEIANGRYGREIDTYALGIILYEMLTGTVPFEGESVGEVLMKHLTAEPDLSRLNDPYRDVVRRALAKDPDQRIKSVGEMLARLPGGTGEAASAAEWHGSTASDPPGEFPAESSAKAHFASAGASAPRAPLDADHVEPTEEPIWKAVRDGFARIGQWWHGDEVKAMNPLAKALLVFALVAGAFMFGTAELFALGIPLLICYGIYYVIWASLIRPNAAPGGEVASAAGAAGTAHTAGSNRPSHRDAVTVAWQSSDNPQPTTAAERYANRIRRRRLRPSWRDRANQELAAKPFRERFSELTGSMLMAALMAAVAALVAPLLIGTSGSSQSLAAYLWLALVGTIGSWAILVPTKFAEGKVEDHVPMRVVLLLLGALVGGVAWLLANALILQLPGSHEPLQIDAGMISHEILGWNRPHDGTIPSPAVFLAYFAFLFVLLRWWRQAEFTRSSRLSLWSVLVCVFWAWLLQVFWWFPQPAGMMAAGVIAFATQMSSPWMLPSQRRALSGEVELTT
jgi:hypothetical protein